MRKGAKDREQTLADTREFVRLVKERTTHGFVLSGDVFKGKDDEGIAVPLHMQCGISNENGLGIFVRAKFLQIDDSRGKHKHGCFVKWCGPTNLSIEELTDIFINVRENHRATRGHRDNTVVVKKVRPVKVSTIEVTTVEAISETQPSEPDILTQEYVPISREEFRENHYGKPKDSTLREMLPMLNEIYKHTKYEKTLREVFIIEVVKSNRFLETLDIRDLFVLKEGDPRNSILSVKLLVSMNILEKNGIYYHWVADKPTEEMVIAICTEFAYLAYIVAEKRKFKEAKAIAIEAKKAEEKRLAEEAELAEVTAEIEAEKNAEKSNTEQSILPHEAVFEVSTDDPEKMTEKELLILIYQKQIKNAERLKAIEEYQEKQSKNLLSLLEVLEKNTTV